MSTRILSLQEIRDAMSTGRLVMIVIWSSKYPYKGVILNRKPDEFGNPEDGTTTLLFHFEGKRVNEDGIGGIFPVTPGQVFVNTWDWRDLLGRIRASVCRNLKIAPSSGA